MNEELPKGWTIITLGEIAQVNPRHARDLDDNMLVTFAPMPTVSERDWNLLPTKVRPWREVRNGFTHFADGDVLFAKITPCMENGKAAIATNLFNGLGCGTTELHVLRPLVGVDAKYLYHFIHQESFRRQAVQNFTGTAGQLRVPAEFIRTAEIPLPPTAEQRRIVAHVEAVFAKVRSSQERLDNIPSILKRFRQAVLAAACDGRLTADWRETHDLGDRSGQLVQSILRIREKTWKTRQAGKSRAVRYAQPFVPNPTLELDVPSSWSLVTVSQLALLDVGFAFKSSEFAASGIRLLRGENVEPGRLRWTETRFFPSQELSGLEHLLIDEGEIILALDRPLISTGLKLARSVKEDLPCLLVQRVMRFKMADPRTTQWLYCNLRLPRFIEHLSKGLTGTDLPHVTGTGVAEFAIGLPSLDEQSEIIERVERLLNLADRLQTRYAKAKAQVNKLTQAVLAKAFRGELVPTEAELARLEGREYESAEQLLERIRATHTASNEDRPRAGREHAAARAQKGTRRYAR